MAVLIDLSNYDTLLIQSTGTRGGTPDGNVYFDKTNGKIEFITVQELPTLDMTSKGGGASDANQLDETLGIKFEAIYAFENQERRSDETLRKYNRWTSGTFKFGGAYSFINSRKPSITADRAIIRGSGWNEYASDAGIDRIYFGNKGLSNIEASSQPFYQLAISDGDLTGTPLNYAKAGQIDEAIQVFGNTGNTPSDATAGDFDNRTYEAVSIRTFGYTYDRKKTTTDLGITELGGYSTGFAVNEGVHLTTGDYTLASVLGGGQIVPWTTMTLQQLDTTASINEFTEATGTFTWILNNTVGNLNQAVAYLDAVAATDIDIDVSGTNVVRGKRVDTWYTYNAAGKVVTRSGADTKGLYIYNVPTADKQRVVFTDDHGDLKTYAFSVSVEADIGAIAKADIKAWYHSFFNASYNTPGAVTVKDSSVADVLGSSLNDADGNNKIIFEFDYTGDTYGGTPNTNKNCVFLCEGDGGATQAKTLYTITQQTTVAFTCAPGVENNA